MSLGTPAYSRAAYSSPETNWPWWIPFFKYYESPGKINYTKLLKLMFYYRRDALILITHNSLVQ